LLKEASDSSSESKKEAPAEGGKESRFTKRRKPESKSKLRK